MIIFVKIRQIVYKLYVHSCQALKMIDDEIFYNCLFFAEIEAVEEEEEFPPLSYEKTKLEHLLEPLVPDQETDEASSVNVEVPEIDTLEAYAELIKKREQIKIELHAMKDQVRSKHHLSLKTIFKIRLFF